MNQYTLLLVDDEEEVIQVIMHKIPWEELGFPLSGMQTTESRRWKSWKKTSRMW